MSSSRVHVGQALFLLPKTKTRLLAEASVEVSTEASHLNVSDLSLSLLTNSDIWIRAKPYLTFSYVFTFDDDSSLTALTRQAFRKRLDEALSEAEVEWSSSDGAAADRI